jgi:hypothetical protein
MDFTHERLKELVSYNSESGEFFRIKRTAQRHKIGDRADFAIGPQSRLAGYFRIGIDSKRYMAHRVAWFYVTGKVPEVDIDHINGIRGDNRFCNLRHVSHVTNTQNLRKAARNNLSGFLGVSFNAGKYRARIYVNKKYFGLGGFDTPEEAHAAYITAKRLLHDGCTI